MNDIDLKNRTQTFAVNIVHLVRSLPSNREANVIANQILRSATAVAANYRAACRARSRVEFIAKLGIVVEECDETCFWLEMMIQTSILKKELVVSLLDEGNQLTAIMVSSRLSASKN